MVNLLETIDKNNNFMDTDIKKLITKEAEEIMNKISGSSLFGQSLDKDNLDMVIVFAYCLGKKEKVDEQEKIKALYGF